MREKGQHDLLSKACCLRVPEKSEEETVCVTEKFWNREKMRIRERERERERKRGKGHHNCQPIHSVASQY